MPRVLILFAVLVVPVVGCGKSGGENPTYTIAYRDKQAGESFEVTESDKLTAYSQVGENGREEQSKSEIVEKRYAYLEQYLEIATAGAPPAKTRRVYSTAERKSHVGEAKPDERFLNATMTLTKNETGYLISADAGRFTSPMPGDFPWLRRRFQDYAPPKPVRVGEPWELDKNTAARQFGWERSESDRETSTATGILSRVYQSGTRTFGVVELKLVLVLRPDFADTPAIRLSRTVTIDGCIDGTSSEVAAAIHYINDRIAPMTDPKPGLHTGLMLRAEGTAEIAYRPRK